MKLKFQIFSNVIPKKVFLDFHRILVLDRKLLGCASMHEYHQHLSWLGGLRSSAPAFAFCFAEDGEWLRFVHWRLDY